MQTIQKTTLNYMEAGRAAGEWPILVVDDAENYRRVVAQMLIREGYKVLEAEDGQAAYDIIRQERGCLKAVITDVHMPRMSGSELLARLCAEYPDVKVLCMSAYPTSVMATDHHFIEKPFTRAALLAIVHDVLAIRPSPLT
jgi:DNA-binding NtrC family response regulator